MEAPICFGDNKTQSTQTSQQNTYTPPAWLSDAAQKNVGFAQNVQSTGFTPYGGQQVAEFGPLQQSALASGGNVAESLQPHTGEVGGLISNYANAGPQQVNAAPIWSQMSPYMNQYVNMALQPQLEQLNQQFAQQNKGFDAQATGAGAYGDTGWGLGRSNLTQQQDTARTGLIGNAYNTAFNTAIGAGAQDVSNRLNASTTNANLGETALGRQLTGANALMGANNNVNQLGGQQTAQTQAQLNAAFNQWMMAQQYPFQTTQLVNSALGGSKGAVPVSTTGTGTSTTSAPDNSGWGILGSALPMMAAPFTGGMSLAAMPGMMESGGGGKADGGRIPGNAPTLVGERGPELFVPNSTGIIVPNEIMAAARALRDEKKGPASKSTFSFGIAA